MLFADIAADPSAPVLLMVGPWSLVGAAVALAVILGTLVGGGLALGLAALGSRSATAILTMARSLDAVTTSVEKARETISGLNTTVALLDGERRHGDRRHPH